MVQELKNGPHQGDQSIEPVYSVKENITVKTMRKLIQEAVRSHLPFAEDPLPEKLRTAYKLLSYQEAVKAMHKPESREALKHARRRFVYEEFLLFQLKMQALRKFEREASDGISHTFQLEDVNSFVKSLPFPLTNAQAKALDDILRDMASGYKMNRLLQGDVGSGKTAVAAIALYASLLSGFQGAMMVPTEILAEQHADSLVSLFEQHDVNVALLTSSVKGKRRRELLERLKEGEIDILVGTHALIQDDVHFKQLGLVITDEQHRFGVEQRKN